MSERIYFDNGSIGPAEDEDREMLGADAFLSVSVMGERGLFSGAAGSIDKDAARDLYEALGRWLEQA